MSLTITIPGAVDVTTGSMAPAVLTIGVGVPGAAGPQGPAGPGVPAGGTAGQYLQKIDGTNYNTDWVTLNLSAYAPLASPAFTGNPTAPTATFGDNDTSISTTAFVQAALAGGTAVAKNLEVYVRNQTGSTIPAGRIVYISGATGNRPLITLAQANNDANSAQTMGFTKTAIANNDFGYVIVRGELENIDTSALTEGVQLYLSPTTAGTWTTTKPSAPQHLVYVGIVVRAHPTLGVILVAVQNGYELNELHDVKITSASNGQVLKYDSAQGLWVNGTDVGGVAWGGITGTLSSQTDLANALNAKLELSGGVLTVNSTIEASTATQLAVFGGSGLNVELSANPSENSVLNYGGLQVQNFSGTMAVTPSGLTFPNASTQTVAYPGSSGFLLKAENLSGLADTSVSRTNLGLGTMATATAADYSTTSAANLLYYPLSSNPSSYLVAADISGLAPLASPALTGNVSIVSNSTGAALFIEQAGTGNILTLHDQATDTNFVTIDANGKVSTIPSTTANAGFNVAHGVAPTTPVNGDIWTTTGGLFARINGSTNQMMDLTTTQTVAGNKTFTNANLIIGSSTATGVIAIGNGATISGSTKTVNIATNGLSGSTTLMSLGPSACASTIDIGPSVLTSTFGLGTGNNLTGATKTVNIGTGGTTGTTAVNIGATAGTTVTVNGATTFTGANQTLGNSTGTTTINVGSGATVSGQTKTLNLGTGGLASSTTAITIGGTTGSTTTLQGTTNGVTQTAGDSSLKLATTAFVTTADNLKANLASPTFTGTPTLPTGTIGVTQTAGNNTTALATTAFVQQEVPAASTTAAGKVELATFDEAILGSSTTLAPTAFSLKAAIMSSEWSPIYRAGFTATVSGTGANCTLGNTNTFYQMPTSGVASGHSYARTFGTSQVDQTTNLWGDDANIYVNFAKRIWISGRSLLNFPDEAVYTARVSFGKAEASGVGDLAVRGIGWKYSGGASNFVQLMVHNGTTLTTVNSSFHPTTSAFTWDIISEGNGNVTLYINGSSVATTSAGPSTRATSGQCLYQEEAVLTTTSTGNFLRFYCARGAIYVQR